MKLSDKIFKRKISIKWKIFRCMVLFTALILLVLWLFQVVFLDDIYKFIKINEIKITAKLLKDNIDSGNFTSIANEYAERNDVCVLVLRMVDPDTAVEIASIDILPNCAIHNTDKNSKFVLYDSAMANGGELLQRFRYDVKTESYYSVTNGELSNDEESMIYTMIAQNTEGTDILFMLNSVISPVNTTVKTLNTLLYVISGIILLLALLLSLVISRRISKPIDRINNSAKILASGNYDVKFETDGYKEISELAGTLNYAAEELGKVEGLRRELIANISHDLRTPLTMIEGYSEVMRDLPGENTPENIQIIIDEAKRLTSLVNDVLDISKIQSGVQEYHFENVNLTQAIAELLHRYNKLTEQDGYVIDFSFNEDVAVITDKIRITQVIYNLVNNAVTYTGSDKRVLVRQSVGNGKVRISVTDSGEGIPPEKLNMIWERYYKVDKVHRRASVGTGLGLSIVKSIMDANNGTYGVESELGKGSTFWIELNIAENGETS